MRSRLLVAFLLFGIASLVRGFFSLLVAGPVVSSPTFAPNPIPIAGSTVHVTAKVTDSTSAVSHVKVRVKDGNGNVASDDTAQVGVDGVTYSADVVVTANSSNTKDGSTIYVYADDLAGNNSGYVLVATQGHDSTPPAISNGLASPNPIPIKGATIHVSAKVADALLPVQYVKARVRDANGNIQSDTTAQVGGDGATYSADIPIPQNSSNTVDGQSIYFIASDTAGNVSSEVLMDAQGHDTTAPVISNVLASPKPIPSSGSTVHVTAKVTDASLPVQSVKARIREANGNVVSDTSAQVGSDGLTYSVDLQVPLNTSNTLDGQKVYLIAADAASNVSSEVLVDTQTHDSVPPVISNIVYSPNPIPIGGGLVHISASVTDASTPVASVVFTVVDASSNLILNIGGQVGLDGVTYSGDVPIDPDTRADRIGERIFITAKDAAGNSVRVLGAFQDNRPHLAGFSIAPASVAGGNLLLGPSSWTILPWLPGLSYPLCPTIFRQPFRLRSPSPQEPLKRPLRLLPLQ